MLFCNSLLWRESAVARRFLAAMAAPVRGRAFMPPVVERRHLDLAAVGERGESLQPEIDCAKVRFRSSWVPRESRLGR